jgi:hypothetical protein
VAAEPIRGTAHIFSINDTYTFNPTLLLTTTFGITRGAMLYFRLQLEPEFRPARRARVSFVFESRTASMAFPRCSSTTTPPPDFRMPETTPMAITSKGRLTGQLGV